MTGTIPAPAKTSATAALRSTAATAVIPVSPVAVTRPSDPRTPHRRHSLAAQAARPGVRSPANGRPPRGPLMAALKVGSLGLLMVR